MDETERKATYVFCETVIEGKGSGEQLAVVHNEVFQYLSVSAFQCFNISVSRYPIV